MAFRMAHINIAPPSSLEQGPVWPWYGTQYISMDSLPPELPLGAYWENQGNLSSGGGNAFRVVRFYDKRGSGRMYTCRVVQQRPATMCWVGGSAEGTTPYVLSMYSSASWDSDHYDYSSPMTFTVHDVGKPIWINTGNSRKGRVLRYIKGVGPATNQIRVAERDFSSGTWTNNYPAVDGDSLAIDMTADYSWGTYGLESWIWAENEGQASILHPYEVVYADGTAPSVGVTLGPVNTSIYDGKYTITQVAGIAMIGGSFNTNRSVGYPMTNYTGSSGYQTDGVLVEENFGPYLTTGVAVTGAAGTPIVIDTTTAHGLGDYSLVYVSGVEGNTNANGFHVVSTYDTTTITLLDTTTNAPFSGSSGLIYGIRSPQLFTRGNFALQADLTIPALASTPYTVNLPFIINCVGSM